MSFLKLLLTRRPPLIDAVWLLALCAYVLMGAPLTPFHADEATQIYMGRDFAYQFLQGDLARVAFHDDSPDPELQYLRLINGSINKYTIGLSWFLAGYRVEDVNDQWDWGADWQYNTSTHHAPSPGLLAAAHWPSALFTAASVAVLFALARLLGGRPVAYLATAYYALNPVVLLNGRRAMMEGSLLFFGLLVVLVAILYLRRRSWRWALAFGAAAGLAVAAKHTNLFVVAPLFLGCALVPLVERLARRRSVGRPLVQAGQLVAAGLAAAAVFFALNPVWWGANPLEHGVLILRLRNDLLAGQASVYGGYSGPLDQLAGFGRQALVALPQYYEDTRFANWIAGEIALYEASPWRGVSIGGSLPGALVLLALVVYGGWRLLRERALSLSDRWLVALWAGATLAATWLLTPLEWQRYYLPVIPVLALLAAFGLTRLARLIRLP